MYTSEYGVMHHFDNAHDPRLHDPDPGPQEKSAEKSCVSFGKDCINYCYNKLVLFIAKGTINCEMISFRLSEAN